MSPRLWIFFLLVLGGGQAICRSQEGDSKPFQDMERCTTALEVIEKNLTALGGKSKIRSIASLIIEGVYDYGGVLPSEEATFYVKKPDKLKEEGLFNVILCNGERFERNRKGKKGAITGGDREVLEYRVGFYHNGFSLLNWEAHFPSAELTGIKKYGQIEQYMIRFPKGQSGRELVVYVDTKTFLIDRLVFTIRHPKAKFIKVVNRLRNFKEIEGVRIPTTLIYDKVGWKAAPEQFLIREIKVNPKLNDASFEQAEFDFGNVVCGEDALTAEIKGSLSGFLLTNIRQGDLESIGVLESAWLHCTIDRTRYKVRYLKDVKTSAKQIKPNGIYLCRYPLSDYPRLMLISLAKDVDDRIPCKKGDPLILSKIREE